MGPDQIKKLNQIRMLILDVDGVMTDGFIFMHEPNQWRRNFFIRDGAGIKKMIDCGYLVSVITGSKSEDIRQRVQNLGIHHFYEGALNKIPAFEKLIQESDIKEFEMAYMGDDYFDLPILKRVGFSSAPRDAHSEVLKSVDYISIFDGGRGSVRELCDAILLNGALRNNSKQQELKNAN
jgi:3-deoxy-D-manno-octulosonate 8-phosphate phosphatase (KDO 8-P phosphatase)